jgi:hypothetical protein
MSPWSLALGWVAFLVLIAPFAYACVRIQEWARTRYSRPVVETTPTAGRGTNRVREWWEREPVNLDRLDGVTPQCWTPGPRGNHAYGSRVGGGWECMRCGDQVTP